MLTIAGSGCNAVKADLVEKGWEISNDGWKFVDGSACLDNTVPTGREITTCRLIQTDPAYGGTRPFASREGLHPLPNDSCIELKHFRLNEQRCWTELPTSIA